MATPEQKNNIPPAPEQNPVSPESVALETWNKLKELRTAIENKAPEADISAKIDAAGTAMEKAKNLTAENIGDSINDLKQEVEKVSNALTNLPADIGTETVKKAGMLRSAADSMIKSLSVALNKTTTVAKNSFERIVDGLASMSEKIIGTLNKAKPGLAKMMSRPFMAKMVLGSIGTEYATMLQEWLGQDIAMTLLFDEINKRLPADTVFMGSVNENNAILQFNDAYAAVKATKQGDYTKVLFFRDIQTSNSIDFAKLNVNADGKKVLTMADIAKAAEKYATQLQNKPATPPAAPPVPPT